TEGPYIRRAPEKLCCQPMLVTRTRAQPPDVMADNINQPTYTQQHGVLEAFAIKARGFKRGAPDRPKWREEPPDEHCWYLEELRLASPAPPMSQIAPPCRLTTASARRSPFRRRNRRGVKVIAVIRVNTQKGSYGSTIWIGRPRQ